MPESKKSKQQLMSELQAARRKVRQLEASLADSGPDAALPDAGDWKYRQLYESMTEGLAIHEIVYDAAGQATDFRILDVNPSYETLTGFKRSQAIGALATQLYKKCPPDYLAEYAHVAQTGAPLLFEAHFQATDTHLRISVFSPEPGQFATIFQDISALKRAERLIRKSDERYRLIVETANEGIMTIDDAMRITYANKIMLQMLGYSEEELLQLRFPDLLFEEDLPRHREEVVRRHEGHSSRFDRRFRRKDGSVLWTTFAGSPLRDENGNYIGSFGMFADITTQKLVLAQLQESEDKFRSIFDSISEFIFVHDMKTGKILDINQPACEAYGYTREEMLRCAVSDLSSGIAPYDQEHAIQHLRLAIQGTPQRFEWHAKKKSGELFWLEICIRTASIGQSEVLLASAWDISERKHAEDMIRREKSFTDAVINSVPGLLYVYDEQGNLVRWNQKHAELTGYSHEELSSMKLEDWYIDNPKELTKVRQAIGRIFIDGFAEVEGELRHKDGSKRLYYLTGVPLSLEGKHYFTGIGIDITERKRMQELLVQTEKMLSVGGLAAGMAHEINNPLSVILQSVQVVLNRLSNASLANVKATEEIGCSFEHIKQFAQARDIYALLHSVNEAGARSAKIISSMLDFSRKTESNMAPTDINALLESAVRLCAHDYDLKKKYDFRKIHIVKEFDHDMPLVACTSTRIEQVVMNLLRNAAQAMADAQGLTQSPSIRLRTGCDHNEAFIQIQDNGPGIPEDVQKRIFEPFFTTKKPGQGTGLGLSVSYFIITENHSGSLEVESCPGQGSTFTIRLPLK